MKDGVVLYRRVDDSARTGGMAPGDRQVVGLGAPASEDDLAGAGTQTVGDNLAGLVECLAGFARHGVRARRVAEPLGEERQHGLDRFGPHGRRRRVIEIRRHRG